VLSVIHCDVSNSSGTRQPRDRFLRQVFISRCWAVAGGPSDDVIRDTTIEEMSRAVFPASLLGGYIIRPTEAVQSVSE
jgi:hypothetical protein